MKDYRVIGESEAIFIPLGVMVYPIGTLVRSTSVTISQAGLKVSKSLKGGWDGPLDESWKDLGWTLRGPCANIGCARR